jgi:hypothetical protein
MDPSIIKGDWVEKEKSTSYVFSSKYQPRYLILTATHLVYYHKHPDRSGHFRLSVHDKKEIALLDIDDQKLLEVNVKDPNILHVQLPQRSYRFRFNDSSEVIHWRNAIYQAKKKIEPDLSLRQDSDGGFHYRPSSSDLQLTIEQQEMIIQFEQFAFCTIEQAKFAANIFFESLALSPSKDRNTKAKEVKISSSTFE